MSDKDFQNDGESRMGGKTVRKPTSYVALQLGHYFNISHAAARRTRTIKEKGGEVLKILR